MFSTSNRYKGLEELDKILEFASHDMKFKIRDIIDNYTQTTLKKMSRMQFINIPAYCLQAGDIILDLKQKHIQRVEYVSHYDSTMTYASGLRDNTVMICYGEYYDCDNVPINSEVTILVDMAEYVLREIQNPKEENDDERFE